MIRRILFFSFILIISGCSGTKNISEKAEPKQIFTPEEISDANEIYLQGITQFQLENYEFALDLLTMAYVKLPDHAGVNYAIADAYLATGDLVNSAYYAKQAVKIEPSNKFYILKLIEVHIRNADSNAAISEITEGLQYHPRDLELLYLLAGALAEQRKFNDSNGVYNRILKITGNDIALHYQKFRNFAALDIPDSAIVEIRKISELDPDNVAAFLTLGQLYIELDRFEEAEAAYKKYLNRHPASGEIKVALADLFINQGDWLSAGDLLKSVMADTLTRIEVKTELIQFLLARNQEEPENEGLQQVVTGVVTDYANREPNSVTAQSLAADFYYMTNNIDMAILKLERVVELNPDNANAWRLLMQLLYGSRRWDEVIARADDAEEYVPYDVFIRFFTGGSYYLEKDYPSAIKWLKMASEAPSRNAFLSIVFGTLGDAYHSAGDWDESVKSYEESIRLDAGNATAMNNYAYYLSIRNESLEKAYEMSKKSLTIEPENPSYLDTLGWIYFKKGNYEKAFEFIQASIDNGSQSAEVFEHMGDVLEKLGKYNEAVIWWGKALEADTSREHLKEKINL